MWTSQAAAEVSEEEEDDEADNDRKRASKSRHHDRRRDRSRDRSDRHRWATNSPTVAQVMSLVGGLFASSALVGTALVAKDWKILS